MVDLFKQYDAMQEEIDAAVLDVVRSTRYVGGPQVVGFAEELAVYLDVQQVIPCANGTDALQIALMALDLKPGDEVVCPSFTYAATAEVIGLLGLKPVMVDVCPDTFNVRAEDIAPHITEKTKAIVPVHIFGQSVDMAPVLALAEQHGLSVIEDNAQTIGGDYIYEGQKVKTGGIGHIGCTSFFPSKNLGCFGDGGAITTNDKALGIRLKRIANHGQNRLYYHDELGVNSRLDALQAAVLRIKLRRLDLFNAARRSAADAYDTAFANVDALKTPVRAAHSTHVFHQYTLRVLDGRRDALQAHLKERGIPNMIYYPLPLYKQPAYQQYHIRGDLSVTDMLCKQVISLPMHTEHTKETLGRITDAVLEFFL